MPHALTEAERMDRRKDWGRREDDATLEGQLKHYGKMAFEGLWKAAIMFLALWALRVWTLPERVDALEANIRESEARDAAIGRRFDGVTRGLCWEVFQTSRARYEAECPQEIDRTLRRERADSLANARTGRNPR